MKKLGAAVIGTGWVSDEYIKAFKKHPQTAVVAIASRELGRAKAKAAEHELKDCESFTDLDAMLKKPGIDIVAVCTPHHLHVEQGIACARANKHVVVEKPIAIDVDGLRKLDSAIRAARVKSIVSFVLRWNPMFDNIRAMLESKLIGDVYYAEVDYLHGVGPWYRIWEWMSKRESGGSALLAGGCHAVDGLRYFLQDDAVEVTAYSNRSRRNALNYEYDPNTVTLIRFAGGALGKVACSLEARMPYVFNVELYGDKGAIRNNKVFSTEWPGQKDWAAVPTIEPDSGDVSHHPFQQEIDHFVDCIRSNIESHASVSDAVKTHEICLAADLSASQGGRPVQLPLP
jgi:predicted dehydrogenase